MTSTMQHAKYEFVNSEFETVVSREFFDFMCGDLLGWGIGRWAFAYKPDPTLVCKIETTRRSFQNVMEWDLWKSHSKGGTSVAKKWLAPCTNISHSGAVLLQKRTKPVPYSLKLPKYVPNVLCGDMKRENWGIYRGRLVCHDYGRHEAVHCASRGQNLDKAMWLDAENGHFKNYVSQVSE